MKSIIRKIAAVGAAAVIAVSAVTAASAASVSSDKIVAKVSYSSMSLYNVAGDRLLFTTSTVDSEYPSGTSCNYISVDGHCTEISTENDAADEAADIISGSTTWRDIDIKRIVSIIPNSVNGAKDTVEIKLVFTNDTAENHMVGGRIFLDTMLEDNDRAPFRVAGVGAITNCVQYEGDIPESFQAFSSLSNPSLVATGTFAKGTGKPDVVQFTTYWDNYTTLIPECNPNTLIGDSAVNAIWRETELEPGESLVCTTYYGLGAIDIQESNELVLGATRSRSAFYLTEDGTGYEPLSVTGYVSNNGTNKLSGVAMYLDLPAGVTVNTGTGVGFPSLAVGEEQQNTWYLEATPAPEERTVTVTVNAESAETGKVEPVVYTFTIPAIAGAEPIPEEPTTEPATDPDPTVAPTTVPDATSATEATTVPATKDEATKSEATPSESGNGTVKTGEAIPAAVILAVLMAGVGAVYFMRKKESK